MLQHASIFGGGASLGSIKHSGKLKLRAVQLGYLARYWRSHSAYLEKLKTFQSSNVIRYNSLVNYKYIGNYLVLTKNRQWRREVILSNYEIVYELGQAAANPMLFVRSTLLWRMASSEGNDEQHIVFQPSTIAPLEGEFELQFMMGTHLLATLTFVFMSGNLVDVDDHSVCLIGSLQGGHDCRMELRQAAKSNGEISPFTMLVLAAKGLSRAIGIEKVFAVSSIDQVALRGERRTGLDYDAMWAREGGALHSNGFYLLEPLISKPIEQISQSHRKRAQRKRERKTQSVIAIQETFRSQLSNGPTNGSAWEQSFPSLSIVELDLICAEEMAASG